MGLPQFSASAIQDLANHDSYKRGEEYTDVGAVRNLVIEYDTYRAHVHGTHRYTVRVWDDEGEVEASCTCPYDWDGICKHMVAVMLTILDCDEHDEPIRNAISPASLEPENATPIEDLLPTFSDEQLRAFILLQANEFPQLADNLRIFAQGTVETDRTVDEYADEMLTALQNGYFHIYEEEEEGDDDEDEYDTVTSILQPYRDTAHKYAAQGNWIEGAKIYAAILHACGQRAEGHDGNEGTYEEDEYDCHDDDIGDLCLAEAKRALQTWADMIAKGQGRDKQRGVEQLLSYFARDAYGLGSKSWESAFQKAIQTAAEAQAIVAYLDMEQYDDRNPHIADVLLNLSEVAIKLNK